MPVKHDVGTALAYDTDDLVADSQHRYTSHHFYTVHPLGERVIADKILQPVNIIFDNPTHTFYCHSFQPVCIWLHTDGTDFADIDQLTVSSESNERNPQQDLPLTAGDDKIASVIGHSAIDEAGIRWIQQSYIGKRYRLAVLINNVSDDLCW